MKLYDSVCINKEIEIINFSEPISHRFKISEYLCYRHEKKTSSAFFKTKFVELNHH